MSRTPERRLVENGDLVVMWTVRGGDVEASGGEQVVEDLRQVTRSLYDVAGVVHWGAQPAPLMDGDHPVVLNEALVDGHFFGVLGVRAALGRLLAPDDELGGADTPAA